MNRIQRQAASDMAYLGAAWRAGFWGPRERPSSTPFWEQIREQIRSVPPDFDDERVWTLHSRWLQVAAIDEYDAVMLKLHFRDNYNFERDELRRALDRFARTSD